MTGSNRHVLMLQGPSSPFFRALGREFKSRDVAVTRVGFCPGDRLYWAMGAGDYIPFRGRAKAWPEFAQKVITERGITDLIMLGDGRKLHKDAIAAAGTAPEKPVPWIVEHGYLRPDLLTIEPWGTGGRSRLMANYQQGHPRRQAEPRFKTSFWQFAVLDTAYHVANMLGAWALYPHYRNHAIFPQYQEWAGWLRKGFSASKRGRIASETMNRLEHAEPIFLFPLQLETDYQIRDHAPAGGVQAALDRVVLNFAQHAPQNATLVVKVHPMDNGLAPWQRRTRDGAVQNGVAKRVVFLDGGDLDALLKRAAGCVTINSTVGLTAAEFGCPVKTLGHAIYDRVGITSQTDLPAFFQAPDPPDHEVVQDFIAYLHACVLVRGGFDGEGVETGARNIADRILAGPIFAEGGT